MVGLGFCTDEQAVRIYIYIYICYIDNVAGLSTGFLRNAVSYIIGIIAPPHNMIDAATASWRIYNMHYIYRDNPVVADAETTNRCPCGKHRGDGAARKFGTSIPGIRNVLLSEGSTPNVSYRKRSLTCLYRNTKTFVSPRNGYSAEMCHFSVRGGGSVHVCSTASCERIPSCSLLALPNESPASRKPGRTIQPS